MGLRGRSEEELVAAEKAVILHFFREEFALLAGVGVTVPAFGTAFLFQRAVVEFVEYLFTPEKI